MECASNKGLYALIKCLGFGLVFNQLPEKFIAQQTQATWILSFHLTSTDKTNANISGVNKLKNLSVLVYTFIICVYMHLAVHIEVKIRLWYHDALIKKITLLKSDSLLLLSHSWIKKLKVCSWKVKFKYYYYN